MRTRKIAFSFSGPKERNVDNKRRSALERRVKYVVIADFAAEADAVELRVDERTRALGSARLRSKPRSGSAAKMRESRSVWNTEASSSAAAPDLVREICTSKRALA